MIHLELSGVPPSVNHAYENVPKRRLSTGTVVGGGRRLSQEGRTYLLATKVTLARQFAKEMKFFEKNAPYLIVIKIFFKTIENQGYPKNTSVRYKTVDTTNRIKLLEDALKEAGGFDDSQTITTICQKLVGVPERTSLWIWDIEKEETPFDWPLINLR